MLDRPANQRKRHAARAASLVLMVLVSQGCTRSKEDDEGARSSRAALEVTRIGLDQPRLQPSGAYQFSPGVGAGGGQVFTAWADGRYAGGAYYHLMGTRLSSSDGGLLDRTSVRIDDARSQFGGWPTVAFAQDRFLVTWLDDGPYRPWYRLFALDGTPVGPPEFLPASLGNYGGFSSASAASDHFLIVWGDYDGPSALGLALVRADGTRTTPDGGLPFGPPPASSTDWPRTAWTGAEHLVAWRTTWRDGGISVGSLLVAVDAGIPMPGAVQWLAGPTGIATTVPAVACSEGWAAVAWASRAPSPEGVELALAPPDGGLGAPTRLLTTVGPVQELALVAVPGGYLLARSESADGGSVTVATPFSLDGGLRGADQLVCTACGEVALTATPGGAWAVWSEGDWVVGAPLAADGRRLAAPLRLAWSANAQSGSSVAARDGGFLVSWYDDREDSPGLRVSRVDPQGVVEQPAGVMLPPGRETTPRYPGTSTLVATPTATWLLASGSSGTTLYELTANGDPIPGGSRQVADRGVFLQGPVPHRGGLVWAMAPALDPGVLVRVAPNGALLDGDAGRPLPAGVSAVFTTALASTGQRLMLVSDHSTWILMRWLDEDGGVVDAGSFVRPNSLGWVDAWSGDGAVLVVEVPLNPAQLRILRVREDGTWLDAAPLVIPLDAGTGPGNGNFISSGSWNGQGWDLAVAWSSGGQAPTALVSVPLSGLPSVRRWLPTGTASTASDGRGRVLVSSNDFDEATGVMANRVTLTLVSDAANGAPCASGAACASGLCAEGVCCDRACGGANARCETCLAARGAPADGTCSLARAGDVCRAAASTCDVAEACDGQTTSCPGDAQVGDGAPCPSGVCSAGVCRLPDGGVAESDGGVDGGSPPGDGGVQEPRGYRVGSSCSAGPSVHALALLLLALGRRRRLVRERR